VGLCAEMYSETLDLDGDSGPAIPPKAAARNTVYTDPAISLQPPPKHGQHSEADINARLGIVRRRPVPPPPAEDDQLAVELTGQQTGGVETTDVAAVNNCCDSGSVSKPQAVESLQGIGTSSTVSVLESSQFTHEADGPLLQSTASNSKPVKTYPVPAPRLLSKKVDPVETVPDNTVNLYAGKKDNAVLTSGGDEEKPKPAVAPRKLDPARYSVVTGVLSASAPRSSSTVAATMTAKSRSGSVSTENRLTGLPESDSLDSITRTKEPGKLRVDGLLAQQITVAMKQRSSILSAVTGLSTTTEATSAPLTPTARTYVESVKAFKTRSTAPLSPDGSSFFCSGLNDVWILKQIK
jgi:hypothetical protein